jgi:hypothetical protein
MTAQPWPTSPEWRKFAAKIADGCTRVLAAGERIAPQDTQQQAGSFCPLGAAGYCKHLNFPNYPNAVVAAMRMGVCSDWTVDFTDAFDFGIDSDTPSSRLGLAYRQRFARQP